jgi:hypothetical protein
MKRIVLFFALGMFLLSADVVSAALGEGEAELEKRFGKPSVSEHYRAGDFAPEVDRPVQMLILDQPGCEITVFLVDGKSCREVFGFDKPFTGDDDPRIRDLLDQNPGQWRAWQDFRIRNYFRGTPPSHVWSSGQDDLSTASDPRSFIIVDGEKPGRVEVQSPVWRAFLD